MQSKIVIAALLGAVSANQYLSLQEAVNTQAKSLSTAAVQKELDETISALQVPFGHGYDLFKAESEIIKKHVSKKTAKKDT
jgi:hypothetical protein